MSADQEKACLDVTHIFTHCLNMETKIFNTSKINFNWPFAYYVKSKDKKVLDSIKACRVQDSNLRTLESKNKNT